MVLADPGTLGAAVRQARKTHGLTQAELAGLAGTGPRFISELERGKASAELGKVLDVLAVLGLHLLLTGADA
ncbi:helix-turn-helix transcriptional regulator [Luteimonas marina]|uniref:Helix-turn-helix transcriptional regulator n=1 Tax=Luteimonas marina TaxID=488485 RepID=A0A5C5U7U5_9GAMM|nr:helix-turn-helix transcriptional regulator [Luteimonas marina]